MLNYIDRIMSKIKKPRTKTKKKLKFNANTSIIPIHLCLFTTQGTHG